MPEGLIGGTSRNDKGESLCFDFNLDCCGTAGDSCPKGKHQCCKPGCFKRHPFVKCTGQ